MLDWINFHHLKGDPFSTQPLLSGDDFQYLFVKTNDISNHVDPIAEHFAKSKPRLTMICGERGMGKSTCLHYVSDRLSVKGVMTIIVSEQPALIEKMIDPIYGIGTDTLFQILTKLLSSILSKHPEFYDEYGAQFEEIASVIGYDLEHRIPSGQKTPTAGQVVSKLEQLCEIMNECKIRSLISIDNFDRLNAEIALVFLKSNYAQPIFELLERSGATILLTAKSEWLVGSRKELSYLGKPIVLSALNPGECKILVKKRIANWLEEGSDIDVGAIFEDAALTKICVSKEGIPRDILEFARACLVRAAQKEQRQISVETVEEVLRDEDFSIAKFYKAIRNDKAAETGLNKLDRLRQDLEYTAFKEAIDAVVAVHGSKEPPTSMVDILGPAGIVSRIATAENPSVRILVLDQFVEALLKDIDEEGLLGDFVGWFTRVPQADIVPVASPKERQTREELQDSIGNLRQKIAQPEALRVLNEISAAYAALLYEILNEDNDIHQSLVKVDTILRGAASLVYLLHATLTLKARVTKPPIDSLLRDFLLRESFEKDVVPFFNLIQMCQLVSMGASFDQAKTQEVVSETERLLGVFLKYAIDKVAGAIVNARMPLLYTESIEQISKRISPRIKSDTERYFIAYFEKVPFGKFLIVGWSYRDQVLARVYGDSVGTRYEQLGPYKWTVAWLPQYVERALANQKLTLQFGLRMYNSFEVAKCLSVLATRGKIIAEFMSKDSTSVLQLETRSNGFGFSFDPILAPRFDLPIREPEQIVITKKQRTIKMDPNTPYENLKDIEGMMKKLEGEVLVVDMFLEEEALTVIKYVDSERVRKLDILTSKAHISENFKVVSKAFCEEFRRKGCEVEFRIVDENDTKDIHDRYVIDAVSAYDIPPLSVGWKKLSHIKDIEDDREETLLLLRGYWARASLLEKMALSRAVAPAIRVADSVMKRIRADIQQLEAEVNRLENSLRMLAAVGKTMPSSRYRARASVIRNNMATIAKKRDSLQKEILASLENKGGTFSENDLAELGKVRERIEIMTSRLGALEQNSRKM